jgi:hypothetical protein
MQGSLLAEAEPVYVGLTEEYAAPVLDRIIGAIRTREVSSCIIECRIGAHTDIGSNNYFFGILTETLISILARQSVPAPTQVATILEATTQART